MGREEENMSFGSDVDLTWLGHATFELRLADGEVVLVDPWLRENPSCPERFFEPGRVDAILVTHAHFDHVTDVARVASASGAKVVCCLELGTLLGRRGVPAENIVGMNLGGTVEPLSGLRVTMVKAEHSSGLQDEDGTVQYAGVAAGFVVRLPGAPTIYFAGDTALFGDMKLFGEVYQPEVAVLPIGDHFTMGPADAARAAHMLGVSSVVPCHFGTFPLLTGTPAQLRSELGDDIEVFAVEPGGKIP
jgi:L-ascorbate metabolism protein UlaG (beta-lactamase superfamily)